MSYFRDEDLIIIPIPKSISLYGTGSKVFIDELTSLAEAVPKVTREEAQKVKESNKLRAILIVQNHPSDDLVGSWLSEIHSNGLLEHLAQHLMYFRWLLHLIRHSEIPWIFMSAHHCMGSLWELAMSCHRRYWFDPSAKLGFPEIESGAYAPGGALESFNKNAGRTKEKWQSNPVLTASVALDEGLIHFCSKGIRAKDAHGVAVWESASPNLVRELIDQQPRVGLRAADMRYNSLSSGDLPKIVKDSIEQFRESTLSSAWESCWQLVKDRAKFATAMDFGSAITTIAASHFFSPKYSRWILQSHRLKMSANKLQNGDELAQIFTLSVDISESLPPVDAMIKMLNEGVVLLLFGSLAPGSLAENLELFYGRLERNLGNALAQQLWSRSVSWSATTVGASKDSVIRWLADGTLTITNQGNEQVFFRLGVNLTNQKSGYVEWQGEKIPDFALNLVTMISDGVFLIKPKPLGIPLSATIRLLALEEVMRLAKYNEGDLSKVCESLRKKSWGFSGDEELWHQFLKSSYDHSSYQSANKALDALMQQNNIALWEVGTWKHARSIARRNFGPEGELPWNATATSQHLAIYLGLVVKAIACSWPNEDQIVIDTLAMVSLGFPVDFGSPMAYVEQLGHGRLRHMAQQFWPGLLPFVEAGI